MICQTRNPGKGSKQDFGDVNIKNTAIMIFQTYLLISQFLRMTFYFMYILLLKHLFSGLLILDLTDSVIGGAEGPDRIFVGGLPYYFTEEQIRELLESFG